MEPLVRVGTFLGVLTVMLLWEGLRPRRSLSRPRREPRQVSLHNWSLLKALQQLAVRMEANQ